ncbi:hemin ABC transporter substrate-binding protein [Plesiomonas shigelloides]|uniref:hemin ABC transporter substrate-binding protein n=1 Tax=Plesiomonas shigelloides TaxID=703 RepID=UPI00224773DD|nr:hemin ABC transporter substrate-binding protein [Plesiomonas shigelloides]MCX2534207.1 hemin ABC transporter substrate-binding protein [Plesiomonas shigelloides]
MKQMRLSRYALLACLSLPTVTLHAAPTDSAATNTHPVAASAIPPTAPQAAPKIAPTRVISAGSNVTEIIVALGAGDVLVGVDSSSRLPADSKAATLGYIRQLPAEGMLALRPDYVIGSDEMAPASALTALQQAKIPLTVLPSDTTPEALKAQVTQIAALLHKEAAGQTLQTKIDQQLEQLAQTRAQLQSKQHGKPLKAVYLLLHDGRPPMIAGGNTPADTLLTLAGAVNPAASVRNYQTMSAESLLAMQPDLIVVSERNWTGDADSLLAKQPLLQNTPAGRNKAVLPINGKALIGGIGLSTLSEAQRLANHLNQQ